ncbi:MAG TPA: DNA mismatch repair protein MutS, partial [Pyrinomonadaceae bacterium]
MAEPTLTPMLRQYHELKQQHPGTILFFRLGDFYELFFDDAVTGARELEITLTARHKERGGAGIPMCGVPHHSLSGYIARLIRKGFRVAICEQTEDPSKTKKLVRREVVRVITPGTAIDPQLVESRECVYLAAVCGAGESYGVAFLDLSTGEFRATEAHGADAWQRIRSDIESYSPRELLFPASLAPLVKNAYHGGGAHAETPPPSNGRDTNVVPFARPVAVETANFGNTCMSLSPLDDWLWEPISCASLLLEQFGAHTLEGYGLEGKIDAVAAAGACLRYARETQRDAAAHVNDLTYYESRDHLVLDPVSVRNLELVEAQNNAGRSHTLFGVIDSTVTGMGARLLRAWLLRPSLRRGEIEARLAAVEDFHGSHMKRDRMQSLLKDVADLERLIARISMNTATPRDLAALRRSLEQVPTIRRTLSDSPSSLLQVLRENADELTDVRDVIAAAISDDPPLNLSDGGAIRTGYSVELDELRTVSGDAKGVIAALEARERARSGINSLRVRFNNVFGYFIEVSKGQAARVPTDYERRQTLANAERYTTLELKELEQKVLGAEGRIGELEATIFAEVRAHVATETKRLQTTAHALAMLDVLAALATTAVRQRYQKPTLHDGDEIEIVQGRLPV